MTELPSGTVTFLFTDLEGSTRLWDAHPKGMQVALARHDAIGAALDAQMGLSAEAWRETGPLLVRMGVHTGEAQERDGDYFGTAVNRAARVMAVAHGGQVLCSSTTAELVEGS